MLSATAALVAGELQIFGDTGVDDLDDVEIRINGSGDIEILDDGVLIGIDNGTTIVTSLSPDDITSGSIRVDLGSGSDLLRLPLIQDDSVSFSITVVDGLGNDRIDLGDNVGTLGNLPTLDLSAEQIHLGGALGSDYQTDGVTLSGGVILDGTITFASNGGQFDASSATLSASTTGIDLSIDTADGLVRLGAVDNSGGANINALTLTNASDVTFGGSVTVGALDVDAGTITVQDDVEVTAGSAVFESSGVMTFDPAITVETNGNDLTFVSGVTGTEAFAAAPSTMFASTGGGTVTFRPQLDSTPIEIGTPTIPDPNALQLASVGLFDLFSGFGGFTIGSAMQSGRIGVFESTMFAGDLHLDARMGSILIAAPLTATGNATFSGNNSTTTINADMSGLSLTFNDSVRVGDDGDGITLTATSGNITFNGTVDSVLNQLNSLTLNSPGNTVFAMQVGASDALASLVTDTAGSTAINGSSVTTSGQQEYGDSVTLGANATLTAADTDADGEGIEFSGTVTGGTNNLSINGGGFFAMAVSGLGTFQADDIETDSTLSAASVNVTGDSELGGDVTASNGSIVLGDSTADDVTLTSDVTLTASNLIDIAGSISGPHSIVFDAVNGTDVEETIGTDVVNVTTTQGSLTAGTIDITGNLTTAAVLATDTGGILADGNLDAGSTVTSAAGVDVGGTSMLGGDVTASNGSIVLGDSTADDVTLASDVTLTASNVINIAGGVSGPHSIVFDAVNGTDVEETIGTDVVDVTTAQGALTAGTIDITGNLTTAAALATDTGGILVDGNLDAGNTVTSAAGVDVGGTSMLGGDVTASNGSIVLGDSTADDVTLTSDVTLTASNLIDIAGGVSGPHSIVFDAVNGTDVEETIGTDVVNVTTTQGSLTAGTIDITGNLTTAAALETDAGGILVDGNLDAGNTVTSAAGVDVGGTSMLGGDVTASIGSIVLGDSTADDVTLTSDVTLMASNLIDIAGSISGPHSIVFDAVNGTDVEETIGTDVVNVTTTQGSLTAGTIDITGNLTTAAALGTDTGGILVDGNLDAGSTVTSAAGVDAGGTSMLGGDVTSSGSQIYSGAVTVTQGIALRTTNGSPAGADITFGSTVSGQSAGAQSLMLAAGTGGDISFSGAVGAVRLGAVTIDSARDVSIQSTFDADSLVQTTGTGTTTIDGATTLVTGLDLTTVDVVINADVDVQAAAAAGFITLVATNDVQINADMTVAGDVDVTAVNGAVMMQDSSLIDAGSGTIRIIANQAVTVGELRTSSAAADTIQLTSTTNDILLQQDLTTAAGGSVRLTAGRDILDDNDNGGVNLITTGNLWLSAVANIGQIVDFSTGAGNAIDVSLSGVLQQAEVTDAGGDIFLRAVGDLSAVTGAIIPDADGAARALIEATGDLDLGTAAGIVMLTSGDSLGLQAGGTLTVPDTGFDVGSGDLRLVGGTDVVDASGRDLGLFTANTLSFASGSAGGATTLRTEVNTLLADLSSAAAGTALTVEEVDGVLLQSLQTNNGDIRVNAALMAAGDLSVARVDAGMGHVVLDVTSQGGAIVDADDTVTDVVGGAVALRATDGIANNDLLEIDATMLAATTVAGDINVLDVGGDLIIDTVDGTVGVSITGGAPVDGVQVAAASSLTVNQDVTNSGGGNVDLLANDDVSFGPTGGILTTSGNVNITADADNDQNGTGGAVLMLDTSEIDAGSGRITISADESITLGGLTTTSAAVDAVRLTSTSGGIVDGGDTLLDVVAVNGSLVIDSVTGIGHGNALETNISSLDVRNTLSGDVMISEADALLVQSVESNNGNVTIHAAQSSAGDLSIVEIDAGSGQVVLDVTAQGGAIVDASDTETDIVGSAAALLATNGIADNDMLEIDVATLAASTVVGDISILDVGGGLTIGTVAGTIGVNLTAGAIGDDLQLAANGSLTVDQSVSNGGAGIVSLVANGTSSDLTINSTVVTTTGSIDLLADDDVLFGAGGGVTSTSGQVHVEADADLVRSGASGAIIMADGTVIDAGNGDVSLLADAQVTLSQVRTTGDAIVESANRRITDGGDIGVDIIADNLALIARTGIGAGEPLETAVNLLSATSMSGGIEISNDVGGLLTIGSFSGVVGVTNTTAGGGVVSVVNNGALTVNSPVGNMSGGDVTLTALNNGGNDDSLTINSQVAASGRILLNAGTDLLINDSGAANDIFGMEIIGNADRTVSFGPNVIVRSMSGAVSDPVPFLVVTPFQVTRLGNIRVDVQFGRPGESNFMIDVDVAGVAMLSGQFMNPGTQTFTTLLLGPPDPNNPAATIPITVTITDDPNITFFEAGQELVLNPVTVQADPPTLGFIGGLVFDLDIEVPEIQFQSDTVTESAVSFEVMVEEQPETIETQPIVEQQEVDDVRMVIVEKIGPDGEVEETADGTPIRRVYRGEDAERILDDRFSLFETLRSGRFRAWLQEGADGTRRLLWSELLRDGRPAEGSDATRDRPPTDETQSDDGTTGDDVSMEGTPRTDVDLPGNSGYGTPVRSRINESARSVDSPLTSEERHNRAQETDGMMGAALAAPAWIPLATRGRRVWRSARSRLSDVLRVSTH